MVIKFTLLCKSCGCKMELKSPVKSQANHIECQNCGQILHDDEKNRILTAFNIVEKIPVDLCAYQSTYSGNEPGFTVVASQFED